MGAFYKPFIFGIMDNDMDFGENFTLLPFALSFFIHIKKYRRVE